MTSGSNTTTFVPSANRLAYLPRTPPEKSYSDFISDRLFLGAFFILVPFASRCPTSADNPNRGPALSMYNYQKIPSIRSSYCDPSLLFRECSSSEIVIESVSPKIVDASSKLTRCLRRFARSLRGSHSNRRGICPFTPAQTALASRPASLARRTALRAERTRAVARP